MVSLTSLFSRSIAPNPKKLIISEGISLKTLRELIPVRNLSEEKLKAYAAEKKAEILPAGETLFRANEIADVAIYLLKGVVTIHDGDNKPHHVNGKDVEAKFPLSSGIKHTTTAVAKTKISFLRVSEKVMTNTAGIQQRFELTIPYELKDCRLLQSFAEHYQGNELEIPSQPSIAIQLREAIGKDVGLSEVVKIVQLDPIIAAKLIDVANCPLYYSATPVKSCFDAVKKIGLNATRDLVISLSLKSTFNSQSLNVKRKLDVVWKNSLHLSSLSYVLATVSQQKNPEEALLAGLVCDIGIVPFLNFVANMPSGYYSEEDIVRSIPIVKGAVGASILKKWGFADEFIDVPLLSESWFHDTQDEITYNDLVILSRLHDKMGKKEGADLPAIMSVPAAKKLKNIILSPKNSLNILHDARRKVDERLRAFSAQV